MPSVTTLLAVLFVHSLFLAGVLWHRGRPVHRANGVLAGLVAVIALLVLQAWLSRTGAMIRHPHLIGVFLPIWFTVGPLCLIYIRRALDQVFTRWELLLATPSIAVFALMLPYYLRSAPEKLEHYGYPGPAITLVLFMSVSLLIGGCAVAAARTLRRHESAANPRHETPWRSRWLRLLMGALAAYTVLDLSATVLLAVRGHSSALIGHLSLLILVTLIYGTGYLVVVPDGVLARVAARVHRAPPALDAYQTRRLAARLDHLMTHEQPWLEERLRLDDLARRLDVSRHQLSQVLNHHLGTSFYDYVNSRRIDQAQRLLRDPLWDGNVLSVAMASGFGSSASFYRAFRKHVGGTPKAYLQNLAPSQEHGERASAAS